MIFPSGKDTNPGVYRAGPAQLEWMCGCFMACAAAGRRALKMSIRAPQRQLECPNTRGRTITNG
jgi:hypothetical protein